MQPTPTFGHEQIVTELIRGVLDTVGTNPGLSPERRASAQQTVVCTVMSYSPRDAIETMLAGQCVVYDALMRDGARDLLRGQSELMKIKARPSILASGKMFIVAMEMAIRMQGRAADQLVFARPLEAPATVANGVSQAPPATPDVMPPAPSPAVHPIQDEPARPAVPVAAAMNGTPAPAPATANGAPAREPRPDATGAVTPPLTAEEIVQHVLLQGLSPSEKQEFQAARARTQRVTGQSTPISAAGNAGPLHPNRT